MSGPTWLRLSEEKSDGGVCVDPTADPDAGQTRNVSVFFPCC